MIASKQIAGKQIASKQRSGEGGEGGDVQEAGLEVREWLGAMLPLGLLMVGAAGIMGATYWLLVGGVR